MMNESVLLIGLHPDAVDLSSMPDLTKETLIAGLQAEEKKLAELGFTVGACMVDAGATAEDETKKALSANSYDIIMIGAGVRVIPRYFLLFEKLINVVHEHAPRARICFNTRPHDTTDAILRWSSAPAAP